MNTALRSAGLVVITLAVMLFQSCGSSNNKDELPGTQGNQVPIAPSQLVAQARSANEVRLTWVDNSSIESQFKIVRSGTVSGPFVEVGRVNANVTEFINQGLSGNTSYYYKVSAINSTGSSPETAIAAVTTPPAPTSPPTAPSNLRAQAVSASTINLSWVDNSDTESAFLIERSSDNGANFIQIASLGINQTSYQSAGLAASTSYVYRVRANNPAGNSAYTANASATTLAAGSTYAELAANVIGPRCVACHGPTLQYRNVRLDAYAYVRQYVTPGTAATSALYRVVSGSAPTMPPGNPLSAAQVSAIASWINAGALNNAPDNLPPQAPTNLVATALSSSVIGLAWTDQANNETSILVERSSDNGATFVQIASLGPDSSSYLSAGLNARQTYFYRVRASNASGSSAYSGVASATTESLPNLNAPSNLIANAVSASTINLAWTDNSNSETAFLVERSNDNGVTFTQIASLGANVTSYQNTGLTAQTSYKFRVRAQGIGGLYSAYSNVATGTTSVLTAPLPSWTAANTVAGNTCTSGLISRGGGWGGVICAQPSVASSTSVVADFFVTADGAHAAVPTCPSGYSQIGGWADCGNGFCFGNQLLCMKRVTVTAGMSAGSYVQDIYVVGAGLHVVGGPACNGGYTKIGTGTDCNGGFCLGNYSFCQKK